MFPQFNSLLLHHGGHVPLLTHLELFLEQIEQPFGLSLKISLVQLSSTSQKLSSVGWNVFDKWARNVFDEFDKRIA